MCTCDSTYSSFFDLHIADIKPMDKEVWEVKLDVSALTSSNSELFLICFCIQKRVNINIVVGGVASSEGMKVY